MTCDPPQNERPQKFSLRFWIGIILLTTNQPLGWVALLVCSALAIDEHSEFIFFFGIALYALTWGMLGLGALLAGPEGLRYSHLLLTKSWRYIVRHLKIRQR